MPSVLGRNNSLHTPNVSGNANNGLNAGPFYLNVNNPSSNANVNIGSRTEFASYVSCEDTALTPPLGGIHSNSHKC